MQLSEFQVYLSGAIIGLAAGLPLTTLLGRSTVVYGHKNAKKAQVTWKSFWSLIILVPILCAYSLLFHYPVLTAIIFAACALGVGSLYCYMCRFAYRKYGRYNIDKTEKLNYIYCSLWCSLALRPIICIACISALLWIMPDIVEVTKTHGSFRTRKYYVMPFTEDTRPGKSYLDNATSDTLYRVIVRYAFLGEELHNTYALEATFAPHQFARLDSRVDYAMTIIPPIMLPSSNRKGRFHTRRIFLTDSIHLSEFSNLDMTRFGLKSNLKVDHITPPRDRTLREDPIRFNAYKYVDPDPYGHNRKRSPVR
ncbi:MAG: hypothetical protein K2K55_00560 [Duncaniella sp.]|nr:hypothetical protein [Duncaniella sp.]